MPSPTTSSSTRESSSAFLPPCFCSSLIPALSPSLQIVPYENGVKNNFCTLHSPQPLFRFLPPRSPPSPSPLLCLPRRTWTVKGSTPPVSCSHLRRHLQGTTGAIRHGSEHESQSDPLLSSPSDFITLLCPVLSCPFCTQADPCSHLSTLSICFSADVFSSTHMMQNVACSDLCVPLGEVARLDLDKQRDDTDEIGSQTHTHLRSRLAS
eukprot:752035-Hanusia_phi.AAC.4